MVLFLGVRFPVQNCFVKEFNKTMKDISFRAWPKKSKLGYGTNVIPICIFGRETGLTYCKDTKNFSVSLSHPMTNYWLSILEPMWAERNKGKCPVCHDTGWDGHGYTLCCVGCNPSIVDLMVDKHAERKRDENCRLIIG